MSDPKHDERRLIFAFAHDFRSYLRTVLTRIQLVQGGKTELPEQDRLFLDQAGAAAGDMNRLLSAMVSFYDVSPSAERTGLRLLIRGVLLEMKPALMEAQAQVAVSVSDEADAAVPKAFHAVMKELLTNSCLFHRPDQITEIEILARLSDPQTLAIVVSDNGLGVAEDWMAKIFLPFQRLHSRSEFPGFGLGLALCQRIVQANHGTIRATPSATGGLSVNISLPLQV
jgi:signal transduction histidine kinase